MINKKIIISLALLGGSLVGLYKYLNRKKQIVKLIGKKQISPDTYIFSFQYPDVNCDGNLKIGQHFKFRAQIANEIHERKYTPTSLYNQKGTFDVPIKIYHKTEKFPLGGTMTQYLDQLAIGSSIDISEPNGKILYQDDGNFMIDKVKKQYQKIFMIAGGTGITPVFQLIQYIALNEKNKNLKMFLLFANKTEADILLRDSLETLKKITNLEINYTLDQPSEYWQGLKGYISKEMLQQIVPNKSDGCIFLHCGPRAMNNLVKELLSQIGVQSDNIHKF